MINVELASVPVSYPWYKVWWQVLRHPSVKSYDQVLADPSAKAGRAILWLGISSLLVAVIATVIYQESTHFNQTIKNIASAFLMIGVPVSTIISFLAVTAIYHLISKGLGGSGTYNQMIYACGAFYTPVYLLSTLLVAIFFLSTLSVVLGPSGLISGVQNSLVNGVTLGLAMLLCCVTPFGIALGIFAVFQSVFAISAVEKTTSGKAFLSWLITTVALILLNQAMQEVWKVIGSVLSRGS